MFAAILLTNAAYGWKTYSKKAFATEVIDPTESTCALVDETLVISCPEGYEPVDEERCERVMTEMPTLGCPPNTEEREGKCYGSSREPECPEGFTLSRDRRQCFKTDMVPVFKDCPEGYEVVMQDGQEVCRQTGIVCTMECPADAKVIGDKCIVEERLMNECPVGYELAYDDEYCVREYEDECGKKDLYSAQTAGNKSHHRRLQAHGGHHGGSVGGGQYGGQYGGNAGGKFGGSVGGGHLDGSVGGGYHVPYTGLASVGKGKYARVAKASTTKGKHSVSKYAGIGDVTVNELNASTTFNRLVETNCVYEEIVPAIIVIDEIAVDKEEVCEEGTDTVPVDYTCETPFEIVYRRKQDPVCAHTMSVDTGCIASKSKYMKDMCYIEEDKVASCPGDLVLSPEGICEGVSVRPITYRWITVQECLGFDCDVFFVQSCPRYL